MALLGGSWHCLKASVLQTPCDLYSGSCPKVVVLAQLPFAVEMWAQTGQMTSTTWKNTCGALPVQLQQWHPCEWQD